MCRSCLNFIFHSPFNINIHSDYVWSAGRAGGFGLGDDWQIRLPGGGYALDCADARKTLIVTKSRLRSLTRKKAKDSIWPSDLRTKLPQRNGLDVGFVLADLSLVGSVKKTDQAVLAPTLVIQFQANWIQLSPSRSHLYAILRNAPAD